MYTLRVWRKCSNVETWAYILFFSFLKFSVLSFSVWFCLTFRNSEWLYWNSILKIRYHLFLISGNHQSVSLRIMKKISLIIWCFLQQFSLAAHGIRTIFSCCSVAFFILLYPPHVRRSHLIRCYSSVCRELALLWSEHYLFLLNKRWFYVSVKTLLLFDSLDPSNSSLCYTAWQGVIIR